ncbi:hypothetical protein A4D02_17310 [Niastella koreensis]|uniref:DUF3575 domain-containing protein n=2 Tax=Niastella koreensis TaxID=354356 RepID=G8TE38_NIAKG|nr:DUF3575 domain-containing protein [Niastella koreensis]AEV97229.1 hypothetical protein Niako_0850 [Niastella koreensis GR20-10]OQP39094.1 hypothetical protein A4D02_17310 [Niastella koreensis]
MTLTRFPRKPFTLSIVCTILLIVANKNSFGQYGYENVDNKFYVSLSPFALIDALDYPSLRISTDVKVYKHFSISVEGALYSLLRTAFYKENVTGFAIKPCIKYYFNRQKIMNGLFIALEYQYKQEHYHLSDTIVSAGNGYYKTYGMTRYINCVNIKMGEVENFRKRWILEWFAGIGIRYFNSFTDLSDQEYDGIIYNEKYANTSMTGIQVREVGHHTYPNITLGLKLGYRLW